MSLKRITDQIFHFPGSGGNEDQEMLCLTLSYGHLDDLPFSESLISVTKEIINFTYSSASSHGYLFLHSRK